MSLTELRSKDVVNVDTGRKLGKVMDIEFDAQSGCVQAIVVPGEFKLSCAIRGEKNGVIIPWERIVRIGDDVILVRLLPGEIESYKVVYKRLQNGDNDEVIVTKGAVFYEVPVLQLSGQPRGGFPSDRRGRQHPPPP